ncbi:YncE family protein [Novosphingobium pentaromativorans]|nr:gluconolactonase [Novosphingobium pentaromativorans]
MVRPIDDEGEHSLMRIHPLTASYAGLALLMATAAAASTTPAVTGHIAGPDGGWDYASVDPAHDRLYVARSTSVTVIDLPKGKALPSIGAIAHSHAVVPLPGTSTLMVTSGHDDSVRFLDTRSGRELGRTAVGKDPDGAFYSASLKLAVVMNAKAGTVSEIDPKAMKVVRTITLKPGLEYPQQGPGSSLFANNEDENELETADLATGKPGKSIALTGCEAPSGLAYDARSGMLISACDNGKAAVVDARSRKLVKLLDIGQGPDAVILDAARRKAYIPCGRDGTLSIIALDGARAPRVTGAVKTEPGARTGALDPRTGKLYLPTAKWGAAPAGQRPKPVPGTFHVLVVSLS